eukprot:185551_1
MTSIEIIDKLIHYIDTYRDPELLKFIPDIKQLCLILEEATSSYLQFDIQNTYNEVIESTVLSPNQHECNPNTETKDDDAETKMQKRLQLYKQKSMLSQLKHTQFKTQISNTIINSKSDIFFMIALYTYAPNIAYYTNYYNILKQFLIDKYNKLNKNHFKILHIIMEYIPTSISFDDNSKQITFKSNNSLLSFEKSTDDFQNVISKQAVFFNNIEYENIFINCYIISKGDEMWLGLVDKNIFNAKKSLEREKNVLLYYGGRQRLVNTEKAFGHWDSGKGAIHGFGNVEKKDIAYYEHGHWISFFISKNSEKEIIKIYNNDKCVFEGDRLPNGDNGIYFMCTVDDDIDVVFVEKAMY